MNPWTKAAAVFSIMASMLTIYDVAFRPKNAPSIWTSIAQQLGIGTPLALVQQPLPMIAECGKAKVVPSAEGGAVSIRIAPGREHKEMEKIKAGTLVLILQETAGWYLLQVSHGGLQSSVTGWATARQIDKVVCSSGPAVQQKKI